MTDTEQKPQRSENAVFLGVMGGMGVMLLAAIGFALMLDTPFKDNIAFDAPGLAIGVAATAPLIAFLYWFMRTNVPAIARFREDQISHFAAIGFTFTPLRIALMALGAGVTEELMFRGAFQEAAYRYVPVALAIVLPNIVFGLLHMRTLMYAAIAGLVGCWLGFVYWASGNLLAPIVAHFLYDVYALEVTRRAVKARDGAVSQN